MNEILLPVFYLPSLRWWIEFLKDDQTVVLEQYEYFPKQTFRNRTFIYGANGKLPLIIPILHNGKRVYKEIEVSNAENWRSLHWKSIKTAYQSSPYFEYYESQLINIFDETVNSLLQFNLKALQILMDCLKIEKDYALTKQYDSEFDGEDWRNRISAKEPHHVEYAPYYQVFSEKLGFINDLSVLDLICNLGPESVSYIKKTVVFRN